MRPSQRLPHKEQDLARMLAHPRRLDRIVQTTDYAEKGELDMAGLAFLALILTALFTLGCVVGFGIWLWRRSRRGPIGLVEPLDIGTVISGAFSPFGGGYAAVWLLLVLAIGLPKLVSGLFLRGLMQGLTSNLPVTAAQPIPVTPAQAMNAALSPPALISVLVLFLIGLIFHIAAMRYVIARRSGGVADMAEALRAVPALVLPVIVVTVLSAIGVILASLFLVWPGLLLLLSWSVAMPAVVAERLGPLQGIRRSHALSIGSRGRILLIYLALFAIDGVIAVVVGEISRVAGGPTTIVAVVLATVMSSAFAIINVGITSSLYTELVRIHGGFDTQRGLAEIFS